MLVVDASFAVEASLTEAGLRKLAGRGAIAPALLWSEACSALHELQWRRAISGALATAAHQALLQAPITRRMPARLQQEAWEVASRLGWAKTYDAEYVALARLERCPLLTLDGRLARGAVGEVEVLAPAAL